MKKLFLFVLLLLTVTLSGPVMAQYEQNVGPSFSIRMNKLVGEPVVSKGETTMSFVDNLFTSDPRFAPGQDVFFKLIVKNTSSVTIKNVTVKDFVPTSIEPIDGPGNFDASTRTITFSAGDFAVNEEKSYILKMRVLNQDRLPTDKGLFCLVNKSQASNDNASDEDTAQFCVEKQVSQTPEVPSAGPEYGLILLSLEGLALSAGLMLKKINK